ncbi:MAG: SufE family protein [Luteibaculaceae bacterium]
MTLQEKEQEIISEFAFMDDWMMKYEHIIELGKSLPLIDENKKTEDNIIKGCQSRVWLTAEPQDGAVFFKADSDALITKGIIALLVRVLNGEKPETIAKAEFNFIDEIGLKEHLSPTRSNGLVSMIKQMKFYALALHAKN